MMNSKRLLMVGLLAVASCKKSAAPPATTTAPLAVSDQSSACAARASLDEIDTRIAVPLLPVMANHQMQSMRDHLRAVQEIVLAAGRDDFAAIEKAASRVGYSPQMGQMCTHMGAGAKGFTEQALAFHHTADSIGAAARQRDRAAIMAALGSTLQACTGCHETYRQHIVDEATWTRLTSMAPPTGHHPGG
jgi:hypothetical protein